MNKYLKNSLRLFVILIYTFIYIQFLVFFHELGHIIACVILDLEITNVTFFLYDAYPEIKDSDILHDNRTSVLGQIIVKHNENFNEFNLAIAKISGTLFTFLISIFSYSMRLLFLKLYSKKNTALFCLFVYPEILLYSFLETQEYIQGLKVLTQTETNLRIVQVMTILVSGVVYSIFIRDIFKRKFKIHPINNEETEDEQVEMLALRDG